MARRLLPLVGVSVTILVVALAVAQPLLAAPVEKFPVCHKYGTPAEKTLYLPYEGLMGHVNGHGDIPGCCPSNDAYVDVDGITTPMPGMPGGVDVMMHCVLTPWPTGFGPEGLDWFDNDGTCTWTLGDDLHLEDPSGACSTAVRNAVHEVGMDCVVLDLDGSFFTGQPVDVDLETGSTFTGCPGVDPALMFRDRNGDGFYNNGEDIVLDINGNGILD